MPTNQQIEVVKMFDYWAFHGDGSVQFMQIREGDLVDHRLYDRIEDAPVLLINEDPDNPMRYHGRSYFAPHSYAYPTGE